MVDPNPYDTTYCPGDASTLRPNRRRLACELLASCVLTSTFVTLLTIVAWEQTYEPPNVPNMSELSPMEDVLGTLLFIPLGYLIYLLHPAGWLFWLGFAATLVTKRRVMFAVSMAASVWFGYLWPAHFQGIMGI